MERWFALPNGQHSRKGLWEAIRRYGGSFNPEQFDLRNLNGETEKDVLLFEIARDGKDFLEQSVRDGEQWKFRFFRQRNDLEMVIEQSMRSKEAKKVTDLKRTMKAAQKKKAG